VTVRLVRAALSAGPAGRGAGAAARSAGSARSVLPCVRADGDRLVPTCPDLVSQLHQERERITLAIKELQASRSMLDTVITAAPHQVV
jgi:hypothetical protein